MSVATNWCALVRNDKGGLEPRRFASAAEAATVSLDRGVAVPPPLPRSAELAAVAGWKDPARLDHRVFAKRLGVPPNTVRAAFKKGGLPGAVQHTERIIFIPAHLLRLAQTYGLMRVKQMAAAGML